MSDVVESIRSIEEAVKTLTNAIKNDPDLKQGYIANIAMAFVDEVNGQPGFENISYNTLHQAANESAERFLNNWCYKK